MSEVVIVMGEDRKLQGFGENGRRRYGRWLAKVRNMQPGETLHFSWKEPRSLKFHRMFFGMLGDLFDRQEQFAEVDQLRAWLTVGAGYCEFVPGPTGRMVALPKSIAFERLDDTEFHALVDAVWMFLRSPHAARFLWPHLEPMVAQESIEQVLVGYER